MASYKRGRELSQACTAIAASTSRRDLALHTTSSALSVWLFAAVSEYSTIVLREIPSSTSFRTRLLPSSQHSFMDGCRILEQDQCSWRRPTWLLLTTKGGFRQLTPSISAYSTSCPCSPSWTSLMSAQRARTSCSGEVSTRHLMVQPTSLKTWTRLRRAVRIFRVREHCRWTSCARIRGSDRCNISSRLPVRTTTLFKHRSTGASTAGCCWA